jgi:hypothetical protein
MSNNVVPVLAPARISRACEGCCVLCVYHFHLSSSSSARLSRPAYLAFRRRFRVFSWPLLQHEACRSAGKKNDFERIQRMICIVSTDVARYQKPRTTRKHTKRAFDPGSPNSQPPGIGVAHTVSSCKLFLACGQTMPGCSRAVMQCCRGHLRETQTAFQPDVGLPGLHVGPDSERAQKGTLHGQGELHFSPGCIDPATGRSYELAAAAAANHRVASGPRRTDLTAFVQARTRTGTRTRARTTTTTN